MNKTLFCLLSAIFLMVSIHAEPLKSGPQPGDRVKTYRAQKCNDAADGVAKGKTLCYT